MSARLWSSTVLVAAALALPANSFAASSRIAISHSPSSVLLGSVVSATLSGAIANGEGPGVFVNAIPPGGSCTQISSFGNGYSLSPVYAGPGSLVQLPLVNGPSGPGQFSTSARSAEPLAVSGIWKLCAVVVGLPGDDLGGVAASAQATVAVLPVGCGPARSTEVVAVHRESSLRRRVRSAHGQRRVTLAQQLARAKRATRAAKANVTRACSLA